MSRHSQRRPRLTRARLAAALLCLCLSALAAAAQQQRGATYANPVIAGDFPDPSVIRVGKDYWAMTTTGTWAPHFPILHSRDLVNWRIAGYVFRKKPAWAKGDFWAPEIIHDRGRFLLFYTARRDEGPKKTGTLCVAVATAPRPDGPYADRGPLVCEIRELKNVGSIDAFFVRDERGRPHLVWKADGNDAEPDVPTSIFAQRLSEDGMRLVGARKEILRNTEAWERHVTEGSYIVRRGGWFYHFYSGNACCGRGCDYALGVARARRLLGPWEKSPRNPIIDDNQDWQCPGHGSIVTTADGRDFLLYHSYRRRRDAFNVGREALLDEVRWGADGWPIVNGGRGPSSLAPSPDAAPERDDDDGEVFDDFRGPRLGLEWQWPMFYEQPARVESAGGGRLAIEIPVSARADEWTAAVVARRSVSGSYVATMLVDLRGSTARAGLSAYSWREWSVGVAVERDGKISVWRREGKEMRTLATAAAPAAPSVQLRMTAQDGETYRFAYSADGRDWKTLGDSVEAGYIEGAHIALTAGGVPGAVARFDWVRVRTLRPVEGTRGSENRNGEGGAR